MAHVRELVKIFGRRWAKPPYPGYPDAMSLPELLRVLRFALATRLHSRRLISLHTWIVSAPDLCSASIRSWSRRNKKPLKREHSHRGAAIAEHELPVTSNSPPRSIDRPGSAVNIQARLKTTKVSEESVKSGLDMHHRSTRPHQAADALAPGQPARPLHARDK